MMSKHACCGDDETLNQEATVDAVLAAYAVNRAWTGCWISGPGPEPDNSRRYFRREFDAGDAPAALRLAITAGSRYQLFVNGTLIGCGPVSSPPHHTYYDEYELTPHVQPGINALGVIVYYLHSQQGDGPSLLAELCCQGAVIAATGPDWQTAAAEAWSRETAMSGGNRYAPYQELCDGRKRPDGWACAGFAGGPAWGPSTPLPGRQLFASPRTAGDRATSTGPVAGRVQQTGPWSTLLPRAIPFMRETLCPSPSLVRLEECTDITARVRGMDLSFPLSVAGRPLHTAGARGVEALLAGKGPAELTCGMETDYGPRVDPCILLDLGQVRTYYVELDLEGPAGARVLVGHAERLIDGHFQIALEGLFADGYVLREGRQVWRAAHWRCGRYLRLRLQHAAGPVTLHALRVIESGYPFETPGQFACDDETLNGVFEISRRTLKLCCHEGVYDTPWREAAQWLGDVAAVSLGGLYACFGESRLAAQFLHQAGANQAASGFIGNITNISNAGREDRVISDYSLWWIHGLWEYYLYSGDLPLLLGLYPQVQRIIQIHLPWMRDGLVQDVPAMLIEWAHLDCRGASAVYNALFFHVLRLAERMATLRGDTIWSALCRRVADGMVQRFHDAFWCDARGCYADARVDGDLSAGTSEHANFAAIRFGLCDAATAARIIARLTGPDRLPVTEAQPFYMVVVLEGLRRAGRMDLALALIRERWGQRMLARGATSCFEEWGDSGSWRDGSWKGFLRSHSHAWSACPAEFLIRRLAGIEILAPGCAAVAVKPTPVDFAYAVAYPTPRGVITVRHAGGQFDIHVPDGVRLASGNGTP